MQDNNILNYIKNVLDNMPSDWLNLTTHRLDIYNESLAKTEFLDEFINLYKSNNSDAEKLKELPTAYDYIRLGHPLSCVLEWAIATNYNLDAKHVISFSSSVTPILAVLRKNLLANEETRIVYANKLPDSFNTELIKTVYGYSFNLVKLNNLSELDSFNGSTILVSQPENIYEFDIIPQVDFYINTHNDYGSILLATQNQSNYISEIQHVRRRETIAMTPINCLAVLNKLVGNDFSENSVKNRANNKASVLDTIQSITNSKAKAVVGSSGLSIQYAIMMGLVDHALENYKGKDIRFIVPPNCYGGTNDQARRVAACSDLIEVMDLPVDGDQNMVDSIDVVLKQIAQEDAVPYIIAEIPTNPRVEVPDLIQLKEVLSKERFTSTEEKAIAPVFILDQTFCPNVHFLGNNDILTQVQTIAYVSGSKFPSGGKCTAGFSIANQKAAHLMDKIENHLVLCDNEATSLQYEILAEQLPSMNERIQSAYVNTREFVTYIEETLPNAKINFVSEELAEQGFTPSVFSLDLPTKGNSEEERETYKRALNLKLINLMISKIPQESKYCVSYGQLKGCYWTIPATSTQGTTKEGDKDYIARVALSGNMDLELHKNVFKEFVDSI
ncbi:cystathionine beta-synthase [Pseudofulvibacter geojedonensis]|uniref:Cystathionine beta-synthase n=1 Tax=Pseudofulvibacter geojedonensis TaxID=1123758 RepID=A0ABW3I606_9FLAO